MSTEPGSRAEPGNLRKRRGVAKASITRVSTRLTALEADTSASDSNKANVAKLLLESLRGASSTYERCHMSLIDTIDDEGVLETEQATLDEQLDVVQDLSIRLQRLISRAEAPPTDERKITSRKLDRLARCLTALSNSVSETDRPDLPHLKQYEEQLLDYKGELADANSKIFSLDLEETDELVAHHTRLESVIFTLSLRLKEMAQHRTPVSGHTVTEAKGSKLPKLDVPSFDGSLLNWRNFWEQFTISVHQRTSLSNAEKLVYLQQALRGGSAKNSIEGLSRTGENYEEAIQCLKKRYDRPRLIHQAHVKCILEAPPLKEGTGKEIRKLHDCVMQHLRALKAMGHEPSGPFVTSALELKLDQTTMFEWQKHSQSMEGMLHFDKLLEFLNSRAQATESTFVEPKRPVSTRSARSSAVASHVTTTGSSSGQCVLCQPTKHPLYTCPRFKAMSHEEKVDVLKSNGLCMNCLAHGHFVRQCKSVQRCKRCQKPHHTLLHMEATPVSSAPVSVASTRDQQTTVETQASSQPMSPDAPAFVPVSSHFASQLSSNTLMMTCRVLVSAPDGTCVEARALLDNASSASFATERLAQTLRLPRCKQKASISGVAGISHSTTNQSITSFVVSPVNDPQTKIDVTAILVPKVTRDLPFAPISLKEEWDHLTDLDLADPDFGTPCKVDLLLGVDVVVNVLRHGRRHGPLGTPAAFETLFGWVLAGSVDSLRPSVEVTTCHVSCASGDEILRKFWEVEEGPLCEASLTPEERAAVQHFKCSHNRTPEGRFVVPLPRREDSQPLGESRSMAVKRFLSLERNLHSKGQFAQVGEVMNEYFKLGHAELVPHTDLNKPTSEVFYLPMHVVRKDSSTTTKLRAVFDASMKTSSGTSLNDTLMVGPTVHPSLVDVLLRFRMHKIALVADISKMYRAIELPPSDRDLHRFVWRNDPRDIVQDFRMTRVTFGVSSSSFVANMAVRQNAEDHLTEFPLAARVVKRSFYVDDCLTGAESVEEGVELCRQLCELFSKGGFVLRKWNSSNPDVLKEVPSTLRDEHNSLTISNQDPLYSKTLGIEWHSILDHFRLTVNHSTPHASLTKRALVSDVAKTYDVLGWFSPTVIKAKILLQRVWEAKVDWDDEVPDTIREEWFSWRSQLKLLTSVYIPRYYFQRDVTVSHIQLHGFSDASQDAYAAVVYVRATDGEGKSYVSLVASKTKVSPIKRLTIPRLELCGAHLLAKLLELVRSALELPLENTHAWTDSTIVLNWLDGSPRRFKTYVGNRVSFILDRIPSNRWKHVPGEENPADCASRGLLPQELIEHPLWWDGPCWLKDTPEHWPNQTATANPDSPDIECEEVCHVVTMSPNVTPLFPIKRFSSFTRLIRVTAWVMRYVSVCKESLGSSSKGPLTTQEIMKAESYWLSVVQRESFGKDIEHLQQSGTLPLKSKLKTLHPFLDSKGILRVSGRQQKSELAYSAMYPAILAGNHPLTRIIILSEHRRLLHAGPTLLCSVLSCKYHITRARSSVRYVTRSCVTCLRYSEKPKAQQMGQLPFERVTPDIVFENTGIDYAGPIYIKYGHVRKPTIVKAYICIFVSLSVKAVHLEIVSDLTSDAFIATLRRFISRRGKPKLLWSDHGSNFVGAKNDLKELFAFLKEQCTRNCISQFCSLQHIDWNFIPEKAPHFGGLWESAVKSMKYHLRRVTTNVKLTFEEYSTVLAQVEACLNSRPLISCPSNEDGVSVLTPSHFLIGRPLEALPDPSFSYRPMSLLRRWHLCQNLVRQFWQRWNQEYLSSLRKHWKWHKSNRNLCPGDVVVIHDNTVFPTKWPLGKVVRVFPGDDNVVRVVEIKTQFGTYRRPVTKVALILPTELD